MRINPKFEKKQQIRSSNASRKGLAFPGFQVWNEIFFKDFQTWTHVRHGVCRPTQELSVGEPWSIHKWRHGANLTPPCGWFRSFRLDCDFVQVATKIPA